MSKVHDRGGWSDAGFIDKTEHDLAMWEKNLMAVCSACAAHFNVDEFRRAIEDIEPDTYETLSYFERWVIALETLLIQKGVLTLEEIDQKMKVFEARTNRQHLPDLAVSHRQGGHNDSQI
ncbi:MAG: nitrile hydratase subunit beta [Candidatus Poribacteria bacterium]|nr:nitrile hydratase subunit beta [Candidatus Poribacteria bacterium]